MIEYHKKTIEDHYKMIERNPSENYYYFIVIILSSLFYRHYFLVIIFPFLFYRKPL